jgi:predicted RNase H-like HicB family nuclease
MNCESGCETMKAVRTYSILVEPEPDGSFFVTVPALPGCFTRARTIEECQERAVEAIETHIAGLEADGEPVPEEHGAPQLISVTVAA